MSQGRRVKGDGPGRRARGGDGYDLRVFQIDKERSVPDRADGKNQRRGKRMIGRIENGMEEKLEEKMEEMMEKQMEEDGFGKVFDGLFSAVADEAEALEEAGEILKDVHMRVRLVAALLPYMDLKTDKLDVTVEEDSMTITVRGTRELREEYERLEADGWIDDDEEGSRLDRFTFSDGGYEDRFDKSGKTVDGEEEEEGFFSD